MNCWTLENIRKTSFLSIFSFFRLFKIDHQRIISMYFCLCLLSISVTVTSFLIVGCKIPIKMSNKWSVNTEVFVILIAFPTKLLLETFIDPFDFSRFVENRQNFFKNLWIFFKVTLEFLRSLLRTLWIFQGLSRTYGVILNFSRDSSSFLEKITVITNF